MPPDVAAPPLIEARSLAKGGEGMWGKAEKSAERPHRLDELMERVHACGMNQRAAAPTVDDVRGNWLALAGLAIAGGLMLSAAGLFSPAKEASAGQVSAAFPALPAAPAEPPFPEPGSSCYAYFESMAVAGAASPAVIIGYPTEKAVLVFEYAASHDDAAMLASVRSLMHRIDPNAHLRVIKRTPSSVQGTVLDGSSAGETLFIPPNECHAVSATSVVQEAQ